MKMMVGMIGLLYLIGAVGAQAQTLEVVWVKPGRPSWMGYPPMDPLVNNPDLEYWCWWDRRYKKLIMGTGLWAASGWLGVDMKHQPWRFLGFVPDGFIGVGGAPVRWISDSVVILREPAMIGKSSQTYWWYNIKRDRMERWVRYPQLALVPHQRQGLMLQRGGGYDSIEGKFVAKVYRYDTAVVVHRLVGETLSGLDTVADMDVLTSPEVDFCLVLLDEDEWYVPGKTSRTEIQRINLEQWEVEKVLQLPAFSTGIWQFSAGGRYLTLSSILQPIGIIIDLEDGTEWVVGSFPVVFPDNQHVVFLMPRSFGWDGELCIGRLRRDGGIDTVKKIRVPKVYRSLWQPIANIVDIRGDGDTVEVLGYWGLHRVAWKEGTIEYYPAWRESYFEKNDDERIAQRGMVEFSRRGGYLRITSTFGGTTLWESESGKAALGVAAEIDVNRVDEVVEYPYVISIDWADRYLGLGRYETSNQVVIYNLEGQQVEYQYEVDGEVVGLDFSPDGRTMAVALKGGRIQIQRYDGNVVQSIRKPLRARGEIRYVKYCRSGRHLIVGIKDEQQEGVRLWVVELDRRRWEEVWWVWYGDSESYYRGKKIWWRTWLNRMSFDGELLVDAGTEGEPRVYKYSCERGDTVEGRWGYYVHSVLPGGRYGIIGGTKGRIWVVDMEDGWKKVAEQSVLSPLVKNAAGDFIVVAGGPGGRVAGVLGTGIVFLFQFEEGIVSGVKDRQGEEGDSSREGGWYWVEVYDMMGRQVYGRMEYVEAGQAPELWQEKLGRSGVYGWVMKRNGQVVAQGVRTVVK